MEKSVRQPDLRPALVLPGVTLFLHGFAEIFSRLVRAAGDDESVGVEPNAEFGGELHTAGQIGGAVCCGNDIFGRTTARMKLRGTRRRRTPPPGRKDRPAKNPTALAAARRRATESRTSQHHWGLPPK